MDPGPGPVQPGTGWPDDPAPPATPVARDARDVTGLAATAGTLAELTARQSVCRACPRLVAWREQLTVQRRKSFRTEQYWGRPIPGWGAADPAVVIVGLAPAAHGGNRTGRIPGYPERPAATGPRQPGALGVRPRSGRPCAGSTLTRLFAAMTR